MQVRPDLPPFRYLPSVYVASFTNPNLSGPEPDWTNHLTYFLTPDAIHGPANLQDLYLLLTRVVLPRLIIENRQWMQRMYLRYPDLGLDHPLRYDAFPNSAAGQQPMANIQVFPRAQLDHRPNVPLSFVAHVSPRPILRTTPTPDGRRFVEWLNTTPQPLVPGGAVPPQMGHRASELDQHLGLTEVTIRGLQMGALIRGTSRALTIFWWLSQCNTQLAQHFNPV